MNPDRSLRLVEVCALAGTYLFIFIFSVYWLVASRSVKHDFGFFIARVFSVFPQSMDF